MYTRVILVSAVREVFQRNDIESKIWRKAGISQVESSGNISQSTPGRKTGMNNNLRHQKEHWYKWKYVNVAKEAL